MKKIFYTLLLLLSIVPMSWAQVDDVTLIVNGEGATKDEATTKALRSAIEQAFGVFVSANTEILNDELVKDEIATVASGNIKKYTELGVITKTNGNTEVSLQATVSVKKLTSYAQSHGSSAEFAGATFAANMKLVKLNEQNTIKAFDNLFKQIEELKRDIYDCDIEVGMPRQNGEVDVTLKYYTNENTTILGELIVSTLSALAIPRNMVISLQDQGVKLYAYEIPKYYDEKTPLYSKGIEIESARYLFFYAPVASSNIAIIGQTYDIYDNLDNKYDFIIRMGGEVKTQEEAFLIGGVCGLAEEIRNERGFVGYKTENHYYGNAIEFTSSNHCTNNGGWVKGYSQPARRAYGGPFICIPTYYTTRISTQKKKTEKESPSVVSQLILSIPGKIIIPAERINSITRLSVKKSE